MEKNQEIPLLEMHSGGVHYARWSVSWLENHTSTFFLSVFTRSSLPQINLQLPLRSIHRLGLWSYLHRFEDAGKSCPETPKFSLWRNRSCRAFNWLSLVSHYPRSYWVLGMAILIGQLNVIKHSVAFYMFGGSGVPRQLFRQFMSKLDSDLNHWLDRALQQWTIVAGIHPK